MRTSVATAFGSPPLFFFSFTALCACLCECFAFLGMLVPPNYAPAFGEKLNGAVHMVCHANYSQEAQSQDKECTWDKDCRRRRHNHLKYSKQPVTSFILQLCRVLWRVSERFTPVLTTTV